MLLRKKSLLKLLLHDLRLLPTACPSENLVALFCLLDHLIQVNHLWKVPSLVLRKHLKREIFNLLPHLLLNPLLHLGALLLVFHILHGLVVDGHLLLFGLPFLKVIGNTLLASILIGALEHLSISILLPLSVNIN